MVARTDERELLFSVLLKFAACSEDFMRDRV